MYSRRVGSLLVTTLSICLSASAAAEEPTRGAGEGVPLETVLNLLHLDSADQLIVGGVSEEVAHRVTLPADLRVLATVLGSEDGRTHHMVTALSPKSRAELAREITRTMLESGWTKAPSPLRERTHGFAERWGGYEWLVFCSDDDAYVNASIQTTSRDETRLNLTVAEVGTDTRCGMTLAEHDTIGMAWANEHVPLLEPPAETKSRGYWNDHSPTYAESVVQVETDLPEQALVRHYRDQLVAAGWRAGTSTTTARTAVADVSLVPAEGKPIEGFLIGHCGLKQSGYCDVRLFLHRDL